MTAFAVHSTAQGAVPPAPHLAVAELRGAGGREVNGRAEGYGTMALPIEVSPIPLTCLLVLAMLAPC